MFNVIPLEPPEEGWDRDLPIKIVPMTLDESMDCFWGDYAPFFIPAKVTNRKDSVVNFTLWADATEEEKTLFGPNVIKTRKIEILKHTDVANRMYTAPHQIQHIALVEKSDTSATIMIRQSQSGSPYSTSYQEWFKYEFVSSKPDSHLTAIR